MRTITTLMREEMSYEMNFGKAYNDQLPTLGETMAKVISFFGGEHIYGV